MLVVIEYTVKEGALVPSDMSNKLKLDSFVRGLKEGDTISVVHEKTDSATKTHAQLAKIHMCIRAISTETGDTFESIKKELKQLAGIYTTDGQLKSFKNCTKDELNRIINTAIETGEFLGINLY